MVTDYLHRNLIGNILTMILTSLKRGSTMEVINYLCNTDRIIGVEKRTISKKYMRKKSSCFKNMCIHFKRFSNMNISHGSQ